VLQAFADAERADGNPPTLFAAAYQLPRYHDDESAALLLIWAWRNDTLYGVTPARSSLQRAVNYLLRHAHSGYFVSPPGSYRSWYVPCCGVRPAL
jgi:hypothetical protein